MIRRAWHDSQPKGAGCARARGWLDKAGIRGQLRVSVSLYQVQKVLFAVNRDRQARTRFLDERERLLADYELTAEERRALLEVDFHALYRMGVHSLLLGPLAATLGVSFPDYLAAVRGTKA
jgi:Aromatic-ring-opening dioxygenase LigAB, LigA subunit